MSTWTLEDGLAAYVELLKDDAREQYRQELLLWAVLSAPASKRPKPPDPPALLR